MSCRDRGRDRDNSIFYLFGFYEALFYSSQSLQDLVIFAIKMPDFVAVFPKYLQTILFTVNFI